MQDLGLRRAWFLGKNEARLSVSCFLGHLQGLTAKAVDLMIEYRADVNRSSHLGQSAAGGRRFSEGCWSARSWLSGSLRGWPVDQEKGFYNGSLGASNDLTVVIVDISEVLLKEVWLGQVEIYKFLLHFFSKTIEHDRVSRKKDAGNSNSPITRRAETTFKPLSYILKVCWNKQDNSPPVWSTGIQSTNLYLKHFVKLLNGHSKSLQHLPLNSLCLSLSEAPVLFPRFDDDPHRFGRRMLPCCASLCGATAHRTKGLYNLLPRLAGRFFNFGAKGSMVV